MIRLWWEQAEGHTLKTRFTRKNITVTALSASTLTFSTDPGAQANTSAKVCPGPVLERMLRFPQMSSCTMRALPADTVVLTLACGKFRFNDLDLGTIGGLPRLMDVGQCNDAYGAVKIALALADAFGCGVNDLPLSLVLSWYEQKAVCILLTLLHLGIKNIRLGPTLPAFLSPNILNYLAENFHIAPVTTPEEDLKMLLKR